MPSDKRRDRRHILNLIGALVSILAVAYLISIWTRPTLESLAGEIQKGQVVAQAARILRDVPPGKAVFGHNTLLLAGPQRITTLEAVPKPGVLVICESPSFGQYSELAVAHKIKDPRVGDGYAITDTNVRLFTVSATGVLKPLDADRVTYIRIFDSPAQLKDFKYTLSP